MKSDVIEEEKDFTAMNKKDKEKTIKQLEKDMQEAAKQLDFEKAAEIRDLIFELKAAD
jgi:excinuclease ABC subunit B